MPDRWNNILPYLNEFRSHLSPSFPELEIEAAYNYDQTNDDYKVALKNGVFHRAGLYLLFDKAKQLCYVGKTISFNKRVWQHARAKLMPEMHFIDLIPFDEPVFYFAWALEHLLIVRLQPPRNKQGRADEIAISDAVSIYRSLPRRAGS